MTWDSIGGSSNSVVHPGGNLGNANVVFVVGVIQPQRLRERPALQARCLLADETPSTMASRCNSMLCNDRREFVASAPAVTFIVASTEMWAVMFDCKLIFDNQNREDPAGRVSQDANRVALTQRRNSTHLSV